MQPRTRLHEIGGPIRVCLRAEREFSQQTGFSRLWSPDVWQLPALEITKSVVFQQVGVSVSSCDRNAAQRSDLRTAFRGEAQTAGWPPVPGGLRTDLERIKSQY